MDPLLYRVSVGLGPFRALRLGFAGVSFGVFLTVGFCSGRSAFEWSFFSGVGGGGMRMHIDARTSLSKIEMLLVQKP